MYRNALFRILLFCCLIFSVAVQNLYATHYRAGEITYRVLSGRLYEVTAITYTDPGSRADPSTEKIVIEWGDNTSSTVYRTSKYIYPDAPKPLIQKNTYTTTHLYQTDGDFVIGMFDRNRVNGILNINAGNTKDLAFFVASKVRVNSSISNNQSPILLNPPIDKGCKDFVYIHNPAAYDADGDSLVFKLVPPGIAPGEDAPNYTHPAASDSFHLNTRTGRVYWSKPITAGLYNIAIQITEYRFPVENGPPIIVGQMIRDMQINIEDCQNSPPVIEALNDVCVKVGEPISRIIRASDPNPGQVVRIYGLGGPFVLGANAATISPNPGYGMNIATTQFNWTPFCNNIRFESFQVLFKAIDDFSPALADYNGFFVKVIGPEPRNVKVTQNSNQSFRISWLPDSCNLASRYDIYRRIDSSHWSPDKCEKGVPAYTGFLKIGKVSITDMQKDTSFTDSENGAGLSPLIPYCYRVVAVYPARSESGLVIGGKTAESYSSVEVCGSIIRSKPVITKASVSFTDSLMGAVQLHWLRPDTIDTMQYKPPYRLVFKRGTSATSTIQFAEAVYENFDSIPDSSLVDTFINTKNEQQFYKIELYARLLNEEVLADYSPMASTIYASNYATDNTNILSWKVNAPWSNDSFIVYRRNALNVFEEITRTKQLTYADTGLINNQSYCYRIESLGKYPMLPLQIKNYSQEICGTPVDTVPPCPPLVLVYPPCSDYSHYENIIEWQLQPECVNDIVTFNIYYKLGHTDSYEKIATVSNTVFSYTDTREILKKSIAGCYVVTGVDSFDNESSMDFGVCIDNCPEYRLPNVFTPNGDNINDLFKPFQYRFIDHISIVIYNRWGERVFQTTDIDINWNGTDQQTGKPLSDGVYFYICEVYEQYLDGLRKRVLQGTVQIIK